MVVKKTNASGQLRPLRKRLTQRQWSTRYDRIVRRIERRRRGEE